MGLGGFLSYYRKAQVGRKLACPWLSRLVEQVLNDQRYYYAFDRAEALRRRFLADTRSIEVEDLGAGSQKLQGKQRKIADLARHAASSPQQGRWLFHLIQHWRPKRLLELGTSLGIGTYYQAAGLASGAEMHSLEGCPKIAALAAEQLQSLPNLYLHQGSFETLLPQILPKYGPWDYVFLDGNHRLAPSLAYFEQILPYTAASTVFVFDDLYWSAEMRQAWQALKRHQAVRLSLDVWHFGLLFCGDFGGLTGDFTLCPKAWKPWA